MKASSYKRTMLVAVAFDEQLNNLVTAATTLAHRFDMALHFVHVIEPLRYAPMLPEGVAFYGMPMLMVEHDRQMAAKRTEDLEQLGKRLPAGLVATFAVRIGDPVNALITEANQHHSTFILSACSPSDYTRGFHGFSTALGLMHEAPIPVMVVNNETKTDFATLPLKVLVADDLSEGSSSAVLRAYQFAAKFDTAVVRQVHVHGDFREIARDTLMELKDKIFGANDGGPDLESLWSKEFMLRKEQMVKRAQASKPGPGTKTEVDIRTGNVHEQLHEAIEAFQPVLLVFGHHRTARTRPFLVGRMTARAMLAQKCTILTIPEKSLYPSALRFPG